MKSVLHENAYLDVHAWCFVPHSLRLIVNDLFYLGLIPFQEVDFFETEGFEFYITLGRSGKGINRSRLEMLEIIESEIKGEVSIPKASSKRVLAKSKDIIRRVTNRFT